MLAPVVTWTHTRALHQFTLRGIVKWTSSTVFLAVYHIYPVVLV